MIKLIKRKRLLVAIIVVIVVSLLYCNGFRITYAPDLENSWDAISAFAAWGGVIMSFVAVMVAGIVALRQNEISREQTEISRKQTDIADKQNKIALFEKRYAVYYELAKIVSIGEALDSRQISTRDKLLDAIKASWEISFTREQDTQTKSAIIVKKLTEAAHIITQTTFLFPNVSEKDIDDLQIATAKFMGLVLLNEEIDLESISLKIFINTSMDFKKKYLDMIVGELDLTRGV